MVTEKSENLRRLLYKRAHGRGEVRKSMHDFAANFKKLLAHMLFLNCKTVLFVWLVVYESVASF